MILTRLRLVLGACCLATLAACGGGGDDGGGASTTTTTTTTAPGSQLPTSALQSVSALVAYVNDVIANRTDATSEPIVLGDAVLPTSDTSEPL